jgi:hypothetical protein
LSADEKGVADELSHVGLAFGKQKAVQAADVFTDLIRNSIDQPLLEPTPKPDLPADIKAGILEEMKKQLLVNQFSGDLKGLAATLKLQAIGTTQERAAAAAAKAELALRDILAESNIREVVRELMDDFTSMPFCVSKSPSYKFKDVKFWDGNKLSVKREIHPTIERISPFDFWVLNGTTPQNAEATFERAFVTETALQAMGKMPGWRQDAIDACMVKEPPRTKGMPTATTLFANLNPEEEFTVRMTSTDEREIIYMYGRVRGEDLVKLKWEHDKGQVIDPEKIYEVCTGSVNELIVYLKLLPQNSPTMRPYQVASFEQLNGCWAGIGVLQRVAKAERIARAFTFAAIRNASYSATPTGEIDYTRLKEFYPDQNDLNNFNAGHMYLTNPDRTGASGGKNAINFYNVTNNTSLLTSGVTFFLGLMEDLAGVGKLIVGNMTGLATLGRSHRGISLVMGAESKLIRAALDNFDRDIMDEILTNMYHHMLQNAKSDDIKGDANIVARSTMGYLNKETKAAARQESLNSAVGLAAQGLVDKELLTMLVENVLEDQGVDMASYRARKEQAALLAGRGPNDPDPAAAQGGTGAGVNPDPTVGGSGIKSEGGDMIPGALG